MYRRKYDLLLILVVFIGVAIYVARNFVFYTEKIPCKEGDVYQLTEWGTCSISGVKTRIVIHKKDNEIQCANPEDIVEPKDVASCEYVPVCTKDNFEIGDWGACVDGIRKREIKNKITCVISDEDKKNNTFDTQETCSNSTSNVLLLKDYVSQINSNQNNPYLSNYRNLKIMPKGKFKNINLIVSASTSVRDGRPYSVPDESYYFMFGLNDSTARALGTSRINDSKLDISDQGIIQGLDMPKTIKFDLSNTRLAKSTDEGLGFLQKNYTEDLFNKMNGQQINMTLFLADGRSMVIADLDKRIFGRIDQAYLEYECSEGSDCSIERIPSLSTNDLGGIGNSGIGNSGIGN